MERKELAIGSVLYGKYKIEKVLGSGGFGITYYAKHITLDKYYAIKEFFINGSCIRNTNKYTVRIQGLEDEEYKKYKKKFIEEAKTLAKLEHPNIVKVIDVFEENNTSYLVMPFINGTTLQHRIEKSGAMAYDDAINLIAQISEAIAYIHECNILHLDIKPENIIMTPDNRAVLIDFGSAREYVQDKTQRFTAILTQGYAPLEQYDSNKLKGSYSDIYSLGCVAYFILTGIKPLDAPNRVIGDMPTPRKLNNKIPQNVSDVVMHAIELQAEKRYQTANAFLNDLLKNPTIDSYKTTKYIKKIALPLTVTIIVLSIFAILVTVLYPRIKKNNQQSKYHKELLLLVNKGDSLYDIALTDDKSFFAEIMQCKKFYEDALQLKYENNDTMGLDELATKRKNADSIRLIKFNNQIKGAELYLSVFDNDEASIYLSNATILAETQQEIDTITHLRNKQDDEY